MIRLLLFADIPPHPIARARFLIVLCCQILERSHPVTNYFWKTMKIIGQKHWNHFRRTTADRFLFEMFHKNQVKKTCAPQENCCFTTFRLGIWAKTTQDGILVQDQSGTKCEWIQISPSTELYDEVKGTWAPWIKRIAAFAQKEYFKSLLLKRSTWTVKQKDSFET